MNSVNNNKQEIEYGAWIPLPLAEKIFQLRLRPTSRWQVFMVVVLTWCRYGRKEAWLKIDDIAGKTLLSPRTVKASIKDLINRGLIVRIGRAGKFRIAADFATAVATGRATIESERMASPSQCNDAFTSSNSINSTKKNSCIGLTKRQLSVIKNSFERASELYLDDASFLPMPSSISDQLGLPVGTTYGQAVELVGSTCDYKIAYLLTGAIKRLELDDRIRGQEI